MASLFPGVVVTGDKFIAGDNDTVDKFIAGVNDTGDHWKSVTRINRRCFAGVIDTDEQLIASVVDTSDKYSFAIISKKFKTAPMVYLEAWGHWFMKKPEDKNLVSESL